MRLFTIFLLILFQQIDGFKYLLYSPKSTRSHVLFMNKIADVLIDGGHEIVIFMPELEKGFGSTLNHKKARIIERDMDFEPLISVDNPFADEWNIDESMLTIFSTMIKFYDQFVLSCDYQLKDERLLELLRKEKFDLGLSEFFDPCGHAIFEKIGLHKRINLLTTAYNPLIGILGVPATPSFNPTFSNPELPPISFIGRMKAQAFYIFLGPIVYKLFISKFHDVFEKNGIKTSIMDMLTKSSFWFVNDDELVNFPAPTSHKIVSIAGIGLEKVLKRSGQLDQKLQSVFDSSKKGVIYISFGSVAKSFKMPPQTKKAFVEAIKEFPEINFIWKYEHPEDNTIEKLPNLHLQAWLPQTEIFAQPKLLAFVSHGGMNSLTEATYSGVAMEMRFFKLVYTTLLKVCIPMFTDQPRNALMVNYRKTALIVKKNNITKTSLVEAFRTIINDQRFGYISLIKTYEFSYRQNAKELAKMISEKPMKVDERVLKFTEFATKFNVSDHLNMYGGQLGLIQFYNMDVLATMFLALVVVLYLFYRLIRLVVCLGFRCLCDRKDKKSKSE